MATLCTAAAVILFLCGLVKAMSGYGPGTGLACMALSVIWCLYLYAPYVGGIMETL